MVRSKVLHFSRFLDYLRFVLGCCRLFSLSDAGMQSMLCARHMCGCGGYGRSRVSDYSSFLTERKWDWKWLGVVEREIIDILCAGI